MTSATMNTLRSTPRVFAKVQNPYLYEAAYNQSRRMAQSGTLPMHSVKTGKKFMRSIPGDQPYTNRNGARTISPFGAVSDGNRYSGIRSTGPGHAGLYVGEWHAARAEMHHYLFEKPLLDNPNTPLSVLRAMEMEAFNPDLAFIKQVNYELEYIKGIEYVDIEAYQAQLIKFPDILAVIPRGTDPASIFKDPDDVSAPRGVADAIYDANRGYEGVAFESTRGYGDVQGLNLAHFGKPNELVPIFDVTQAYVYAIKNDGTPVVRAYHPDVTLPDFGSTPTITQWAEKL